MAATCESEASRKRKKPPTQPRFPADRGHQSRNIFASHFARLPLTCLLLASKPTLTNVSRTPPTPPTRFGGNTRVLSWHVPVDRHETGVDEGDEFEVNRVAKERGYKNRDVINVSREGMGAVYEEKIRGFSRKTPTDAWIRIAVTPGDLLVLPAGIYHRFTLDTKDHIRALRLFKASPRFDARYLRSMHGALSFPHRFTCLCPAPLGVDGRICGGLHVVDDSTPLRIPSPMPLLWPVRLLSFPTPALLRSSLLAPSISPTPVRSAPHRNAFARPLPSNHATLPLRPLGEG
ncbi:ARD/ARD' family-domain-containing protein [Mycena sanguinolenta]|nr:ARD/ARD' family-domain-containing protein [Mycena sanguinolenta]